MRNLHAAAMAVTLICGGSAARAESPAGTPALRPLCPDRPGKGTAACTVDAGHIQIETDLADFTRDKSAGATTDTWLLAGTTFKYGLTDRADAELTLNPYMRVRTGGAGGGEASGLGDTTLRAKLNLTGYDGAITAAIDPFVKLPTARSNLGDGKVEGGAVLPIAVSLSGGWSLGLSPEADALADSSGSGRHAAWADSVSLSHSLSDTITAGAEIWGLYDDDPAGVVRQASFDLSAAWIPKAKPDLQIDGGVNLGLNRHTPDVQVYAGLSRRY